MTGATHTWDKMFAELWSGAVELRNLMPETFNAQDLINTIKSAPVVLALYADGGPYTIVKGTDELAEFTSRKNNTTIPAWCCRVANKNQAEMLAAILDLSEQYAAGIPESIVSNFAGMFVVASRRGEAH